MFVAISQAECVPEDGDSSYGPCVCLPALELLVWVLEAFHEEVAYKWVEIVHAGFEDLSTLGDGLGLGVCWSFVWIVHWL